MGTINGGQTASPQTRLLIVEDDPELGVGLEQFFSSEGYAVSRVTDGEEALKEITSLPPYDVVLLDVMLPGRDGFEVLREARRDGVSSPVIFLTVRNTKEDKLRGFQLGADDYVTKPFHTEELIARVQAVLRRSQVAQDGLAEEYAFGDVSVNLSDQTASRNGTALKFTELEFNILEYLIEHRGRTVSRKQLLRDIWGISGDVSTRTIDRHVASLRKKIETNPSNPEYIETVYGIGYRFVG